MFGQSSHLIDFFEPEEYKKCRMCIPTPKDIKCEALLPTDEEPAETNVEDMLQGEPSCTFQLFETEHEARDALEKMLNSTATRLQKNIVTHHDATKFRVHWDEISRTPYIYIKIEKFRVLPIYDQQKQKNRCVLHASFSKLMMFPQYEAKDLSKHYHRNTSSIAIRKGLKSNDLKLVKKDMYILKFPDIPILNSEEVPLTAEENAAHVNVQWVSSAEEASKAVKEFENVTSTKFISYFKYTTNKLKVPIQWDENSIPYITVKRKTLGCQYGKDYNKTKNSKRLSNTKRSTMGSKKVGCKAMINICEVMKFPQHKEMSSLQGRREKISIIRKAVAENDDSLVRELLYRIEFPTVEDHSGHALEEKFQRKSIDVRVVERINHLVNNGIYDLNELKPNLESYVVNELLKDRSDLHVHYQKFMPKKREILNHSYIAFAKRFHSKIDQNDVNNVSGELNIVPQLSDNILFRPYDSADENLLFVHQFDWQKKLLQRFGESACLLETTYNPADYKHPLFFLAVKSNHGYHLVGSFVTQNRTSNDIEEAVQVFKVWSTDWDPSFLQINKSDEEVQSIEKLITGCHVLIYGFDQQNIEIEMEGIYEDNLPMESWVFPPIGSSPIQHKEKQKEDTQSRISNVLSEIVKISSEIPTHRLLVEAELELKKVLEKLKNLSIRGVQAAGKKIPRAKRKTLSTKNEPSLKRLKNTETSEQHSTNQVSVTTPQRYRASKISHVTPLPLEMPAHIPERFNIPLSETLLQNGPHNLSFLQLKSLEPAMSDEEKSLLVSQDPDFKVGWLYDEVINSYLWSLSINHEHIIYASSTVAQIMQRKGSLKRLWQNVSLLNKKYIFIPWNPTERHWILLVVDLSKKCLLYLDPQQMVQEERNATVKKAKHFIDHAIFTKFKFHIRFVESSPRSLQSDSSSCGVYVCMYAKWLANNDTLVQRDDHENYRQIILDEIAGGCLNNVLSNKEVCKICDNDIQPNWIQCTRCRHWLHIECVGLTPEEANSYQYFVCP